MKHRDPIVDEVRQARDAIAKKYDYDIEKLAEALRAEDARSGRKVVRLPPRKPVQVRRAS
jgi:hypothetical protein